MKEFERKRQRQEHISTVTGIILTVGLHVLAVLFISFNGIKYIYPPPAEQTFLLDFTEKEEEKVPEKRGRQPRSENVDPERKIEITQRSQSPVEAQRENLTPETKPDTFGDIPTPAPEPKKEPELDPRAAFPGMARKDTTLTAAYAAEKATEVFKAGQADGNASNAKTDGKARANLEGRSVMGAMPKPVYKVQESGKVVVKIWVDRYGCVKRTEFADETTISSSVLLNAARKAALETRFTMKADAAEMQPGTITYIFNLK